MWGTHQQEAIEYGNLIHEILSFVKTKQDVDLAINKALENGLITLSQKELVRQTIIDIVEHTALKNYFEEGNFVMNEQTIIQKKARTIKPDRMVVTPENKVFLLDYKTGSSNPKYKIQLDNYQKAIEDMGYTVIQKALVYIAKDIIVEFDN
jgi:RecB family exonuclease